MKHVLSDGLTRPAAPCRSDQRGTSLIEILVVIVVFMVGILAVIQIFPKGLQILGVQRNNVMATALARSTIEQLKQRPDQIPDAIVSVQYTQSGILVDPNRSNDDLGPQGDALSSGGLLSLSGYSVGDWQLHSGANNVRRVLGEGRRVPAPRKVGSDFGGLLILNFGPIDCITTTGNYGDQPMNLAVYANELIKNADTGNTKTVGTNLYASNTEGAFDYFVALPNSSSATLLLPTGPAIRDYRVRLTYYVNGQRFDYITATPIEVPAVNASQIDAETGNYPLAVIPVVKPTAAAAGILPPGTALQSIEFDTVEVSQQYRWLPYSTAFSVNDPFEYKLLDPATGVLLFNPSGSGFSIERAGGGREPLEAHVDYDVLDWRILHEEFRLDSQGGFAEHHLAIPSLKVGGQAGPDGRSLGGMYYPEGFDPHVSVAPSVTSDPKADHLVILDLDTGAQLFEKAPDGRTLITVNKSLGLITFNDYDTSRDGIQALELVPGSGQQNEVDLEGHALRALYMSRNEWSVQVLKAASRYTLVYRLPTAEGECAPGWAIGGNPTRLYFPRIDANRKVVIDELNYFQNGSPSAIQQLQAQDFVVGYSRTGDPIGLPFVDVASIDSNAATLAGNSSAPAYVPARGVKGASLAVRVLWNPGSFGLSSDPAQNLAAIGQWGRQTRHTTVQTYLSPEELR